MICFKVFLPSIYIYYFNKKKYVFFQKMIKLDFVSLNFLSYFSFLNFLLMYGLIDDTTNSVLEY